MPLNFEHECPRGHELYADDLSWCTTCEEPVIPLRIMMSEDATGSGPFPQDAMWDAESFDNRMKDLLYGFNDDSIVGGNYHGSCDHNQSAAEDATSQPMFIDIPYNPMGNWMVRR